MLLSPENISKIDKSDMFTLLRSFPQEIEDAGNIGQSFDLHGKFNVDKILVVGMGGSAIGGDLLRCYLKDICSVPVIVNRSYTLPAFVDRNTLVFTCSFSGNTEETLTVTKKLADLKCPVICITSGGKLARLARVRNYNLVLLPNGRQPRTALAFLFIPMIVALERIGLLSEQDSAIEETVHIVTEAINRHIEQDSAAQRMAEILHEKLPLIYTSDLMEAVATRWRCQLAENSKILSFCNILPEMNHNEIVGFDPNSVILDKAQVVLLRDRAESPRMRYRFKITKDIIETYTAKPCEEVYSEGESLLSRMLSLIVFGDFVSFYLAILNKVDPNTIKNIDFLKNELAKKSRI